MDINGFIEELDSLYTERRINDVEPFFNESIEQAKKENLKSLLRHVMIA